jgi:hypothetical protein
MWLKGKPRLRTIPEERAVRSFRGWVLHCQGCYSGADHDVHHPLLVSVFAAGSWPPGNLEARDYNGGWNYTTNVSWGYSSQSSGSNMNWVKIPAVQAYNAAGFYGMKKLREVVERIAQNDVAPGHLVFGAIRQWGQTAEYDDGYRSEYACVDRIYVPRWVESEKRVALAERYGVPATVRQLAA